MESNIKFLLNHMTKQYSNQSWAMVSNIPLSILLDGSRKFFKGLISIYLSIYLPIYLTWYPSISLLHGKPSNESPLKLFEKVISQTKLRRKSFNF